CPSPAARHRVSLHRDHGGRHLHRDAHDPNPAIMGVGPRVDLQPRPYAHGQRGQAAACSASAFALARAARLWAPIGVRPTVTRTRPTTAQPTSVHSGPAAPAPSKNAAERSRVAPAPAGSHCPTIPHGWGSSSGAAATAEIGFPNRNTNSTPSPMPGAPSTAARPVTVALTARPSRASAPAAARYEPVMRPRPWSTPAPTRPAR